MILCLLKRSKPLMAVNGIKDDKYWSFPNTDGTLEKILKVLEGEEIQIDPALQAEISSSPIRQNPTLAKPPPQSPSLVKRGEGRSCKNPFIC
jgi:hypothetical protein